MGLPQLPGPARQPTLSLASLPNLRGHLPLRGQRAEAAGQEGTACTQKEPLVPAAELPGQLLSLTSPPEAGLLESLGHSQGAALGHQGAGQDEVGASRHLQRTSF